jgi:hypothetical protein
MVYQGDLLLQLEDGLDPLGEVCLSHASSQFSHLGASRGRQIRSLSVFCIAVNYGLC